MRAKSTANKARVPFTLRQYEVITAMLNGRIDSMAAKEAKADSPAEISFYQTTKALFAAVIVLLEQKSRQVEGKKTAAVVLSRDQFQLVTSTLSNASLRYAVNPEKVFDEYPELRTHTITHQELQALNDYLAPLNPDLKNHTQDAEEDEEDDSDDADDE